MSKGPIVLRTERSMKNRASSVADLHHIDADPDVDPVFYFMRIRMRVFIWCGFGSGSDFSLGTDPDPAFSCESVSDPIGTVPNSIDFFINLLKSCTNCETASLWCGSGFSVDADPDFQLMRIRLRIRIRLVSLMRIRIQDPIRIHNTARKGHSVWDIQFRDKKLAKRTWSKLRSLTKRSVGTLSMASRDLSLAASEARSTAWYLGIRISGGISQLSSFSSSSVRFTCREKVLWVKMKKKFKIKN